MGALEGRKELRKVVLQRSSSALDVSGISHEDNSISRRKSVI
jgi:hypothetical protein